MGEGQFINAIHKKKPRDANSSHAHLAERDPPPETQNNLK